MTTILKAVNVAAMCDQCYHFVEKGSLFHAVNRQHHWDRVEGWKAKRQELCPQCAFALRLEGKL